MARTACLTSGFEQGTMTGICSTEVLGTGEGARELGWLNVPACLLRVTLSGFPGIV